MILDEYFKKLWLEYTHVTPQAKKIHDLIKAHNGYVFNDHVAFRTFDLAPVNIDCLEPSLNVLGYEAFDDYEFPGKKLYAKAYIHRDENQPKIFLSQLQLSECSHELRDTVSQLIEQATLPDAIDASLFLQGTLWPTVSWSTYQRLLAESEYAAWLSVMGFRANHFTVYVNKLAKNDSLDEVIDLVQSLGLSMNESGGLIKGNAFVGLQQASTLADEICFTFSGGDQHKVKSCYYEFALRYPDQHGNLYQGFVADSADKIFESTHQKLANL